MNYIELIRRFWTVNEECTFSTTDIALYFYLLEVNNVCYWKESFRRNNAKVIADLRISFKTLQNSRNRLRQQGLIDFQTRNGNSNVVYSLCKNSRGEGEGVVLCHGWGGVEGEAAKDKQDKTKQKNNIQMNGTVNFVGDNNCELTVEELKINVLKRETVWLERVAMSFNINAGELSKWLEQFCNTLLLAGVSSKGMKDFKAHFSRWLKIELSRQKCKMTHALNFVTHDNSRYYEEF